MALSLLKKDDWSLLLLLLLTCQLAFAQSQVWIPQGPAPEIDGQVEGILDSEVVGAVEAIAPHPTNAAIMYIGTTNGGIWRTADATAANPTWVPQTDQSVSLSIGALEFDPTDATNQTLVAGIGNFSNYFGFGGSLSGPMRTTDGGATWTFINGGNALTGANISGVAARGATIVVADTVNGIWRSQNTGVTWTQISGLIGSGLPAGASFDLTGVPGTQASLYTNAGGNGIYLSTDTGATWNRVSNAAMNGLAPISNVQIATGPGNVVYAAFVTFAVVGGVRNDNLAGLFRSGDGGTNWVQMGLPGTTEAGVVFGVNVGGQGNINLSLVADQSVANSTIVFVGGDRQPGNGDAAGLTFPNSIGARDFTGRLFRGDSSQPVATQFVHLTHSDNQGAAGGGTANDSAPHGDSREMVFDANGNLIEGDDGGIFRRTLPLNNTGDWFSINGNLQVAELHSVAWDSVAKVAIGGAQDIGTPDQLSVAGRRWQDLTRGDGGVVAVDDTSTPGRSMRYYSNQLLNQNPATGAVNLDTSEYDSENEVQATDTAPLTVNGTGAAITPWFYTPIETNNLDGSRLIIGANNSVYESLDSGQTVTEIGVGIQVPQVTPSAPIGYGAQGDIDVLYVGSGNQVFVRTGPDPANVLTASAAYAGGNVRGVANDPNTPNTAYVVDANNNVFETLDAGGTWTNVTGDLATLAPGNLNTIEFFELGGLRNIVVGADRGAYWAQGPNFATWSVACSGLPNVLVYDLEYDPADRVLLAGTLGRGAWTCYPGARQPTERNVKFACGEGDGSVLAAGRYTTAINIQNPVAGDFGSAKLDKAITVALPSEATAGTTGPMSSATAGPGEAIEIDCDDIVSQSGGLCSGAFCKGFVTLKSDTPLNVVAVYSSADSATGQVSEFHTERVSEADSECPLRTVTIPQQTFLYVPPHTRGDREFDSHGPCVSFSLSLRKEDDDTALVAHYDMHAYECSDDFGSPRSDHTAAQGTAYTLVESAGPDGQIIRFSVDGNFSHSYIDNDHGEDLFNFTANEPVQSLLYVGDTDGSEAGTKTRVFVTLRQSTIEMRSCSIPL